MARKDNYKPGEKFSAEMAPTGPDPEKIVCRDCALKRAGFMGETAAYCKIYEEFPGKPFEILFQNAPCQYHTKETKATG